jgi:hypothetical protein
MAGMTENQTGGRRTAVEGFGMSDYRGVQKLHPVLFWDAAVAVRADEVQSDLAILES